MIPANKIITRFMDTVGNGTGTKNANANGSITPVTYKIQPASGEQFSIHRLMIHIEDEGILAADKYGVLLALTNGILLQVRNASDDSLIVDLCDGIPIKSNQAWARLCYDIYNHNYGTPTDASLAYRLSFDKFGGPFVLTEDEYLAIDIQDNLTGLIGHYFMAQGWVIG